MSLPDDKKEFGSTLPSKKDGRSSKINRNRSKEQEDRLAEKLGGYRVPGSGSIKGDAYSNGKEGDVDVHHEALTSKDGMLLNGFKIEAKSTKKSSFSISEKLIKKAYEESLGDGMDMALAIEVLGMDNFLPDKFVVISEDSFSQLLEAATKQDE